MSGLVCPDSVCDMQSMIDSHCSWTLRFVPEHVLCFPTIHILLRHTSCSYLCWERPSWYIEGKAECLTLAVNGMVAHQYRNVVDGQQFLSQHYFRWLEWHCVPLILASALVRCWIKKIPVPWEESLAVVELGLCSILSTIAVVSTSVLQK